MTNIVITMAGLGSRFRSAGFAQPKYAIEVHGKTLFEWSMASLQQFIQADDRVIFVCLKESAADAFIARSCEELGISDFAVVNLDQLTDGQATTAYLTKHTWNADDSLLIYNIDTFVNPTYLTPDAIKPGSEGWVPCFQAPGDHWSFIKVNKEGWATDAEEKVKISEYASIGLYWFAHTQIFCDAYTHYYADNDAEVKEKYIAPLYQYLIQNGKKVSIIDIPVADVHVLGTPDELRAFRKIAPPRLD